MDQMLLASAKAIAEAFDQEWIVNLRTVVTQSCKDMIPLLRNR